MGNSDKVYRYPVTEAIYFDTETKTPLLKLYVNWYENGSYLPEPFVEFQVRDGKIVPETTIECEVMGGEKKTIRVGLTDDFKLKVKGNTLKDVIAYYWRKLWGTK